LDNTVITKDPAEIEETRAILAAVDCRSNEDDTDVMLDELERLADTAGVITVGRIVQVRQNPDPATYVGSGKVGEIGDACKINGVNLVIFDDELTPSQIKNLENELGGDIRVIDRSMLILDIFALHAVTNEGKLQVELAQLKYTIPRLIGKGAQLSRQEGGIIGMRGPGETKLETDRRHIHRRMNALSEQLEEIEKNRATMRSRREKSGIKQIAIAGYTNAGKSTLLNYLTDAGILAENKLFATLDPTTRKYTLPSGEDILLTDTVGFIRNLPHHLIKAFRSTLDEVSWADIVLVIIDASDPQFPRHTEVTRSLLTELGVSGSPIIYVFNKCDLPASEIPRLPDIPSDDMIYISAKTGQGVDKLIARIEEYVMDGRKRITLRIPNSDAGILSGVYKYATVNDVRYGNEFIEADITADERARGMYKNYIASPELSEM